MTDTPAEMEDHEFILDLAFGSVLITGLGLGMLASNLLLKKDITQVTVIEKSAEVIALVGSQYQDPRLKIIHADAFTYEPDQVYDFVWHDIWSDIFVGNLLEMNTLFLKYRHFVREYQGFWAFKECEKYLSEDWRKQEDERRLQLVLAAARKA